jgi:ATP-binding cassette, subfamily A (ABC1), member 3
MGFLQQIWTLTRKNLTIALSRHWLSTTIRAFLAPIIFMFILSYSKTLFVPPARFGIGDPTPIRSLEDAITVALSRRHIVAFVNSGFADGDIDEVIERLTPPIEDGGATVRILSQDVELLDVCRSSLRGVTPCFAAVTFHSSPSEGPGGVWNYTIRVDGTFGTSVYVDRETNDAQIHLLPLQHAVDAAIGSLNGTEIPDTVNEYPFTSRTPKERDENITRIFMNSLINVIGVAFIN